ncbi:MAG: hypothetical protein JSW73_03130 [Candidatus Woesearchaeota archaeon]|nr:MAG: hypothetical protein JSW73_03130 [Candidatus Woesearchaeota archaeon]
MSHYATFYVYKIKVPKKEIHLAAPDYEKTYKNTLECMIENINELNNAKKVIDSLSKAISKCEQSVIKEGQKHCNSYIKELNTIKQKKDTKN